MHKLPISKFQTLLLKMNMMNETENTNVNDQKQNPQDIKIEHFLKFF
jgi:hypothetical protein